MIQSGLTHDPVTFLWLLVDEHVNKESILIDQFEAQGGNIAQFDFKKNAKFFENSLFGNFDTMEKPVFDMNQMMNFNMTMQ